MYKIICNNNGKLKDLCESNSTVIKTFLCYKEAKRLAGKLNSNTTPDFIWTVVEI